MVFDVNRYECPVYFFRVVSVPGNVYSVSESYGYLYSGNYSGVFIYDYEKAKNYRSDYSRFFVRTE